MTSLDGGSGDDWLIGGHWLGPGCACNGAAYDATLKQQDKADGNRKYVDRLHRTPVLQGARVE